jgi:hypothetical protein
MIHGDNNPSAQKNHRYDPGGCMPGIRRPLMILFVFAFGMFFTLPCSQAFSFFGKKQDTGEITKIRTKLKTFQEKMPEDRVYLMFDKPFYYPGETIWFQAYVRNGADMGASKMSEILHVEWIAPSGNKIKELSLIARKGVASGDISLDEGMAGGLYKIKAYTE